MSSTFRWRTCLLVLGGLALRPTLAIGAKLPWLEYRAAPGCPAREALEQEILGRSSFRPTLGNEQLLIDIVFEDGSFLGQVRFRGSEAVAGRAVRHESCEQVLHAVALIGALMLDAESQNQPTPVATPPQPEPQTVVPTPQGLTESVEVITPPPTKQHLAPTNGRQIRSLTVAPWFSLTLDSLAAPEVRFGPRAGALMTLHRLLPGSQQTLRVSMAQVRSGTITVSDHREASITWTSVRLDVCHGSSSQRLSSLGICAWFDVGKWNGEGWVDGVRRGKGVYWSRIGGAAQWRQRIVGGLALNADLGLMLALSRPEFYFAASGDEREQTVYQPPRVGPVADLGLELHFW